MAKICSATIEKAKRRTRRTSVQWILADPIERSECRYPDVEIDLDRSRPLVMAGSLACLAALTLATAATEFRAGVARVNGEPLK